MNDRFTSGSAAVRDDSRMPTNWFTYDFGYSWPYTWGHLAVLALAIVVAAVCRWRGWALWTVLVPAAIAVWAGLGAFSMHHAVQINEPQRLVTETFLPSGGGRVLDLGAGSGRATVGLLLARPRASVVALDRYTGYYGIDDNTPERLHRNARAAGVDDRVRVEVADMRVLPFQRATFDAAMSVAAIDHLDWPGIEVTLREVARVLKPGGQFLIVGLNPDVWVRLAVPSSIHGGYWGTAPNRQRWRAALEAAGFEVVDSGTQPATVYLLARSSE
jgi:SAM-dependent methyltransferase